MTFWQFLSNVFTWFEARTTRILGLASGTIAILASSNVVPKDDLPYYMAAISILTFWRGQAVSNTVAQAKVIVSSQTPGSSQSPPNPSKSTENLG